MKPHSVFTVRLSQKTERWDDLVFAVKITQKITFTFLPCKKSKSNKMRMRIRSSLLLRFSVFLYNYPKVGFIIAPVSRAVKVFEQKSIHKQWGFMQMTETSCVYNKIQFVVLTIICIGAIL